MFKLILIIFVNFSIFLNTSSKTIDSSDLLVSTPNGDIRGQNRDHFVAFEGIPFAEPPINQNRFEPPKKLNKRWEGTLEANKPGPICIQWNHFVPADDKVTGEEDCLYLNVYTTDPRPIKKLPVVIFIHGGAFTFGSGDFYMPTIAMNKQVVLINFNYRLGPLGFLSTEDGTISGNMGLKDQSMALRWVNENIHLFGGDSNKISLTGNSAGGASVHLHYMSSMSEGLFYRGFSQSGTALMPWVMSENSLEKAKQIAAFLNCTTETNLEMKNCLQEMPAKSIVGLVKQFQPWLFNPFTPFGPVVEYETESPFLSQSPISCLLEGKFQQVPWIVSSVELEGLYPAGEFLKTEYFEKLEKEWNDIAPFVLDFNGTVAKSRQAEVADKIKEFYMKGNPITEKSYDDLIQMISDRLFKAGLQRSVKIQAEKSKASVYLIYYRFQVQYGVGQILSGRNDYKFGVAHGDDTLLMYDTFIRGKNHPLNEEETEMANKLVDLQINEELKFGNVTLEPMERDGGLRFLEIISNEEISMKTTNDIGNEAFWYELIND